MKKELSNVMPDLCDESLDISFEPIPAQIEVCGLEASLEPIEFHATGLRREVEMDGNLGDSAWQDAVPIPEMLSKKTKTHIGPETDVRLLYSPTALYIGAVMYEPEMEHLVAQFDQNDLAIFSDDCLEMIIDPAGRPQQYYHVVVNALCSIYDARDGKINWNGEGFTAKSSRHEDKWIVELKMPFAAFDNATTPEAGEFWGIRFCRERHHGHGAVAVPVLKSGSLNARNYLGKLIFDPASGSDIELNCSAQTFDMGMNSIPVEIKCKETATFALRARIYDSDNYILDEITENVTAPATANFKMPITTDMAMRAVFTLLSESGESINSFVLNRAFPFVAPGFEKLDKQLKTLERGCEDILSICHPVHRGAAKAIKRIRNAIADYTAEIKNATCSDRIVEKSVTEEFAALQNGFREFKNRYNYLVWQTSPWETGSPDALPPADYSPELSLSFSQASNERERVALVFSGLLLDRRLDLRLAPYAIDEGNTYIPHDRFEIYMEPFVDHNGQIHTQPLIRVPGDIITLTPGMAVRVHIVFNSRNVKPGKYNTKIELKPLYDYSIPNREVPVDMEVWNFTLPETREWPIDCFFWGPNLLDNDEAAMLRLMHSRHINWGWTESVRYTKGFAGMRRRNKLPEGKLFDEKLVKTANQEFFDTAKELGMRFVFGWGTCQSMEWHYLMDERLKKMGFTHDDFMFKAHLRDEFKKATIGEYADMRKQIIEENPGWNLQAVYLSSPPPSGATLQDIDEARLTDSHKTWTLIKGLFTRTPEKTEETLNFFRERGCRIWVYNCATTMHTQPILEYYRLFPWLAYEHKIDGIALWTVLSSHGEDGLDHRDGYDEGATMLDSNHKPIPTKRLEAVSKGLEDVAYMFELENQLKRLEGKLTAEEHQQYLDLITVELPKIAKSGSQEMVDEWRITVGTTIDRLSRL
ncbi:MAG: carbohydrate-binding family 9-like protein [Oscillospiraceae bacterium]|nr:carbohydrate-binding family 9-like protein [Oscillospiraceae bacterium]